MITKDKCMKTKNENIKRNTNERYLETVAKAPRGKILNGLISKSAYNTFLNTYTKFCAFITKCTIVMIFSYYAAPLLDYLCITNTYSKVTLKQEML